MNQDENAVVLPPRHLALCPSGIPQDYATDHRVGQWHLIFAHVSTALLDPLLVTSGWPANEQGLCVGAIPEYGFDALLRAWRLTIEMADGPFRQSGALAHASWHRASVTARVGAAATA